MGESIVLLSSPGTCLDIVDGRKICSPGSLSRHLVEFAVLNHHGVNYTQKTLVTGEDSSSSSKSIALKKALAGVFTEDLNNSTTLSMGELIPLEITSSMVEDSIEFVAYKLIWRK